MGLDMYLTRKLYVKNWEHMKPSERHTITIQHEDGSPVLVNPAKISYIEEQVGYWRKANQIHKWFVDNVQDGEDNCEPHHVNREQLQALYDLCLQVKERKVQASEALPTASGFFFGGTDYDEYYYQDIDETIEILKEVLAVPENKDDGEYYYQSSW